MKWPVGYKLAGYFIEPITSENVHDPQLLDKVIARCVPAVVSTIDDERIKSHLEGGARHRGGDVDFCN